MNEIIFLDGSRMDGGAGNLRIREYSQNLEFYTRLSDLRMALRGNLDMFTGINMNHNSITNQSDERLKTHIVDDEINSLEAIKKWRMAGFDWIDPEATSERQFGVIAQTAPEIAFEGYDGYLSINSSKQLQITTHAVQQLALREENTNKVASQALQLSETNEEKIKRLEKRIEELEGEVA